jgi:hypothetical protein
MYGYGTYFIFFIGVAGPYAAVHAYTPSIYTKYGCETADILGMSRRTR